MVLGPRAPLLVTALVPFGALVAEVAGRWWMGVAAALVPAVAAVAVDLARAGPPDTVDVTREAPRSVVLGATAPLRWQLTERWGRQRRVRLADHIAPSLGPVRRASVVLPAHGVARVEVQLAPRRRGRFVVDTVTVRVDGPWRLAGRQADRDLPAAVKVVPVFASRREVELRLQRARLLEIGARSVRARGGGTEFDHLRDYGVDDPYRHIDWAATARAGRPIVRSYRAEQHQTVVALLDNGRMMAARSGGVTRLEHAMDAVMALSTVTTRIGDRLGLVTFDVTTRRVVAPGRGRAHAGSLIETMYSLEPRLSESDYDRAASLVLSRFRRRALVVVLTDLVEPVVRASIAPAVAAISTRHEVVVAAVTNTEIAAWATRIPRTTAEAYQTATAQAALDDRSRATAELRAVGARVVDVDAGRLGPAVVDDYLELKARLR